MKTICSFYKGCLFERCFQPIYPTLQPGPLGNLGKKLNLVVNVLRRLLNPEAFPLASIGPHSSCELHRCHHETQIAIESQVVLGSDLMIPPAQKKFTKRASTKGQDCSSLERLSLSDYRVLAKATSRPSAGDAINVVVLVVAFEQATHSNLHGGLSSCSFPLSMAANAASALSIRFSRNERVASLALSRARRRSTVIAS